MKKNHQIILSIAILGLSVFVSCSKDDPEPEPPKTLVHLKGDTEGSVTIDGTTTAISGGSTDNIYGLIMSPRNMNPPNSYPALNISFGSKPTKDSTYNLATSSAGISVFEDNSGSGYYDISGGTLIVDHQGTSSIATFSNVTLTKSGGSTIVVSGTVTYYDDYIYQ